MTLLLDNHISSVSSNSSESESDSESSLCDTLTSSAAKKATGIKSLCSAVFFDIGEVNFNQPLPESVKKSVLLEKFQPSKNWKGPLKTVGNKQRRVPSSMFNSNVYPFMSYSVKADGVFCAACSVFASGTTCAFIREPHSDWSNIDRHAQRHIKSLTHLSSIQAAYAFISVCEGKSVSVKQQLSQAYNDKVQRNTAALQSIIKTIILCGQQNIPMRGKSDDRSNFMALLNFRAEHDLALSEHLRIASGNSKYISHRIQNELVALCGNQIRDKIVKECIAAKYFSVIVDETTDVSVKEQVSLNLLFVTSDAKRHEEFVSFEETSDTTGETLYNLITGKLQELGLDIRNIVGLGFDGAANMSGKVKGVRGRFQHVGTAEYVHCRSHTLNLAIVNTCSEGAVRNMYNTVSETVNFITASAKRLNIYTNSSHGEDATRLKKFCATRWTRHEETLQRFEENICIILETLAGLTQDHDRETSVKANGLQLSIQNFQFIYTLVVVHHYLRYTKPISYSLQSVDQNLVRASSECKELIDLLKLKRSNDDSCNSLFDEASKLAQKLNVEVKAPRVTARQQYRSNAQGPTNSVQDYFRLNVHNSFLDHLITELQDRICASSGRLTAEMLMPQHISSLTKDDMDKIREAYAAFINSDDLDVEIERWKFKLSAREGEVSNTAVSLQDCFLLTKDLYPNLHTVFHVLLTMPVTSATAERSFSALRRLKSYMRSTMGSERLSALALLHVHTDIFPDVTKVIKDFDATGHRRIVCAFDNDD